MVCMVLLYFAAAATSVCSVRVGACGVLLTATSQLCETSWADFMWVSDSALFEKRNAAVEYPASSSDGSTALKRECDAFASAAEDAAPKAISTLKLDQAASQLYLCEDSLRFCKKGGIANEQGRVAALEAARAKAAADKAAAEAAAKEAARQRELEAASAAVAAESLAPYSDKYSVHSDLSSSHFTALGMSDADADKLALMVSSDLKAKAEAKAAAEAAEAAAAAARAAAEAEAAAEKASAEAAAAATADASKSTSASSSGADSSAAAGETTGFVGGILESISSFFSDQPASAAPDL
jgi:hypothetical protein